MSPAKVTLSPKELELVNNSEWILTKNTVISKVYDLFGQLSEVYGTELAKYPLLLSSGPDLTSAKIAKGEQYGGLPWVMLDHPRHFKTDDTFAIRNFFWWGNFCSITLQLSGSSLKKYGAAVENYFEKHSKTGWYIGTGEDAWQHHFKEENYQPLETYKGIHLSQLPFLKIAKKIPLTDWDRLTEFYENNFREILKAISFE